ncbi:MAG TPA: S-methyl-5'-thioadenosine phosphorylase [Verrucomicrobiae bacterium]|nr:S-methyl-5'-thioadenosine phosphorylase [Verrucomicrobiae bacterium]
MSEHRIGVIGGTGLYVIEGFTRQKWVKVRTPFGPPSDDLLTGKLAGRDIAFLPRHRRGHRILPSELNHRANIWAMKKLGVQWIISVSAVGSLQERCKPCDIVLVDQFLDRTKQSSAHTFFGRGIAAHIAFSSPICEELRRILLEAGRDVLRRKDELHESQISRAKSDRDSYNSSLRNVAIHDGGTYVCMEGPAFSTRAESLTNHRAGYDVIGMTNLGEAKCAREAEIAYATLAMSTDYDCWKEDEHVTLEMVVGNLHRNADTAKKIVVSAFAKIPAEPTWPCHSALKNAILTDKKFWPKKTVAELKPILAKYL